MREIQPSVHAHVTFSRNRQRESCHDHAHTRHPDQSLRRPAHLYRRRPQALLRPRGGGASLLARVVSERLLLFYAQSGAGKSSLINARLIPQLREEEGFSVLPVGRVAGQLPAGVAQVDNIFLFNLMASLDQGGGSPAQLAHLGLSEFLEHLVTDDGLAWRYDPAAAAEPAPAEEAALPAADAGRPRASPWSSTSSRRSSPATPTAGASGRASSASSTRPCRPIPTCGSC